MSVLLIEDHAADARLIREMLLDADERFEVDWVDRLEAGLERIGSRRIDAVLLDLFLPDSHGLETFRAIRARNGGLPVVVMSGLDDREIALRAVQEGAQDYLVKGKADSALLVRSLRYAIERRRSEDAIRESSEKERFRRIFEASLEAIGIQKYPSGAFVEANGELLQLTGFSRSELLGKTPLELGLWKNRGAWEWLLEDLAAGGNCRNRPFELVAKEGAERSVLGSFVVMDLGGERCLLSFLRDVTEDRKNHDLLRELSRRLLRSQDEERRRIARELHDSTASNLVALSMSLSVLKSSARRLDRRSRAALDECFDLVHRSSTEVRTMSYLLHPPFLDELGLASALRWYADGFAERSGIRVDLDLPAELRRLSRDQETTLFRIVQEALTNIHRHSGSPVARIRIVQEPQRLSLMVEDEGRGLADRVEAAGARPRFGVGITGMIERVRQLGGRLEVRSDRGGTTLCATLPLENAG